MATANRRPGGVVGSLVVMALLWYVFNRYIHKTVATDFEEQYMIAKRQGNKIQICVQAGLVAAGYLQAKDEEKYRVWKATERNNCAAAGMQQ
jgi:hypothetical protein